MTAGEDGRPVVPEDERPVAELGYAEASAALDAILAELDKGLVDVDLLESRFRRAIDIVEELDRRIRGARERVDALMPRLGALGDGDAGPERPERPEAGGPAAPERPAGT